MTRFLILAVSVMAMTLGAGNAFAVECYFETTSQGEKLTNGTCTGGRTGRGSCHALRQAGKNDGYEVELKFCGPTLE